MELHKISEKPCPLDIIAVAINGRSSAPHCGLIYTNSIGAVQICDMRFEDDLNVGAPPQEYFWAAVWLEREEVFQVSEFIEFVVEQHNKRRLPLPYSFVYTPDAFDVTGSIRRGAGVTCATFAINIFDRLRLRIVDLSIWRARPKQDSRFREGIIRMAIQHGFVAAAQRLTAEHPGFRLKPWEVYGSVTHPPYPVRFCQAGKLAKTVSKLLRKRFRLRP